MKNSEIILSTDGGGRTIETYQQNLLPCRSSREELLQRAIDEGNVNGVGMYIVVQRHACTSMQVFEVVRGTGATLTVTS